ncbi:hypothetical protein [Flavobacterium sp.]|uniref:hypothetical protein n=1 Tax=Flavobacterium sp. TaxID=239 RepID=UPI003527FF97
MKKYTIYLLAIITLFAVSCNNDCSENVDAPESPSIFVNFIDSSSNHNVFTDSIYFAGETTVKNYLEKDISFSILDSLNVMHVVLENEVILNDTIFVTLNNSELATTKEIKILYATEKKEEECYTLYKTTNVAVLDYENELLNDIYQIKVD